MGLLPIKRHGKSMYPRFCSWPMGYKLSAALAQSIADRVRSARRSASFRAPPAPGRALPPWAARSSTTSGLSLMIRSHDAVNEAACSWGDKVDRCWDRIGVQTHPGKAVNTY